MKCINHPELDAVGACIRCGKGVCIDCKRELGGRIHCQSCADVIPTQKAVPAVAVTSGSKRKTAGNILIVLGTIGYIVSLISFVLIPDGPDAEVLSFLLVIPAAAISSLLLVIGIGIRFTKPTAALVYGIFGLPGGLCSILAIVFGAMSLKEWKKNPSPGGRNKAIAGLVLGIIGIVAWILRYALSMLGYASQIRWL